MGDILMELCPNCGAHFRPRREIERDVAELRRLRTAIEQEAEQHEKSARFLGKVGAPEDAQRARGFATRLRTILSNQGGAGMSSDLFLCRSSRADRIHTSECRYANHSMRWIWADRNPTVDWATDAPWLKPCRHCNPPSPFKPDPNQTGDE